MFMGTQKTIDAIEWLLKERERQKRHVSINVKTVLTEINLESFPEINKRWGRHEGLMFTPQMFEWNDQMPAEIREKLCVKDVSRLERLMDELRKLKAEGYQISKSSMNVQGAESANLTATAEKRTINVTLSRQEGETQGLVAYNEKP